MVQLLSAFEYDVIAFLLPITQHIARIGFFRSLLYHNSIGNDGDNAFAFDNNDDNSSSGFGISDR